MNIFINESFVKNEGDDKYKWTIYQLNGFIEVLWETFDVFITALLSLYCMFNAVYVSLSWIDIDLFCDNSIWIKECAWLDDAVDDDNDVYCDVMTLPCSVIQNHIKKFNGDDNDNFLFCETFVTLIWLLPLCTI